MSCRVRLGNGEEEATSWFHPTKLEMQAGLVIKRLLLNQIGGAGGEAARVVRLGISVQNLRLAGLPSLAGVDGG